MIERKTGEEKGAAGISERGHDPITFRLIRNRDRIPGQNELAERICAYQMLAGFYRKEPDEELVARLIMPEILPLFQDISSDKDIDVLDIARDIRLDELKVEFCRIFFGPGPHVAPYESVHRPEKGNAGKLWGSATVLMKQMVESLGLRYADDFHEMPDHICVEFELMHRLLEAEMMAKDTGNMETIKASVRAQEVLFNEHIRVWVPDFCNKLESSTSDRFYVLVAKLTRDFIELEKGIY